MDRSISVSAFLWSAARVAVARVAAVCVDDAPSGAAEHVMERGEDAEDVLVAETVIDRLSVAPR